jgi:hypothetical protein
MNDSQDVDALRMDTVHKPILAYDEFSNRRIVVLRNPATPFREDAERSRGGDQLAHDRGGVRLGIARDVFSNGHKVIAGPA